MPIDSKIPGDDVVPRSVARFKCILVTVQESFTNCWLMRHWPS